MRLVRKSKDYTDEYGEVWEGAKYYECKKCGARWKYEPVLDRWYVQQSNRSGTRWVWKTQQNTKAGS